MLKLFRHFSRVDNYGLIWKTRRVASWNCIRIKQYDTVFKSYYFITFHTIFMTLQRATEPLFSLCMAKHKGSCTRSAVSALKLAEPTLQCLYFLQSVSPSNFSLDVTPRYHKVYGVIGKRTIVFYITRNVLRKRAGILTSRNLKNIK